jgi:hypothetical protein
MMRQCGIGDAELFLDLAYYHASRMSGKQELHDAQSRLGPHGRKHVGIPCDSLSLSPAFCFAGHISIIPEIANNVKVGRSLRPPEAHSRSGAGRLGGDSSPGHSCPRGGSAFLCPPWWMAATAPYGCGAPTFASGSPSNALLPACRGCLILAPRHTSMESYECQGNPSRALISTAAIPTGIAIFHPIFIN